VTGGRVMINSSIPINTVSIISTSGAEILHKHIYDEHFLMHLENIQPGTYLMVFETPKGRGLKKCLVY
jgi:hypothetical protein